MQEAKKNELTTVFVGNITDKASDTLIRQILMKCGYIVSWKRVQGASGRLQAFGFCEYSDPDAGLRAMRLLSGCQIGDKKLLVKVDSKTRAALDAYKDLKKQEQNEKSGSTEDYDIETAEGTKREDQTIMDDIKKLLKESLNEANVLHDYKKTHSGAAENLEGLDMTDDTKKLVSKEIMSFRETYKDEKKERDRERERDRDRSDRRDRDRDRDRDHDRDRDREREREREKEREKDRERRRRERDEREREERARQSIERGDGDLDRSRRGTPPARERDRRRSPDQYEERDRGGDDEEHEKRRLERIRKDKETSYMEKLREWENRERKKQREYEKNFAKEEKKKEEEDEERTHLLEFLEDYDDDKDDVKYYKGSALARRMRDRELEIQADARDKQREMEEIEEILRKQMADGVDVTKTLEKTLENKENERPRSILKSSAPLKPAPLSPEEITPVKELPPKETNLKPAFSEMKRAVTPESASDSPAASPIPVKQPKIEKPSPAKPIPQQPQATPPIKREHPEENGTHEPPSKKFGFGMKVQPVSKKVGAVFNNDDEMTVEEEPKKKLSRLDEEEKKSDAAPTVEEKRAQIKMLIEKIPTVKEDLFAYELKWDIVDPTLVEKRIKPWVNKKIFEYIGEEENTLVDFICSKVLSKSNAKNILEDVAMVLDDEAEVFVVKMWRLLIYETEAKCLGLVK